jgi:EpsI family protein
MIGRRDMLMALACCGTLGAAEYLRPRRYINFLGKAKLSGIIPTRFVGWNSETGGNIVAPTTPGTLQDKLYSETVARTYFSDAVSSPLMLLAAYGASQSDLLQLHRPESCYPAIGRQIVQHQFGELDLGAGARIAIVELTAQAGDMLEDIVYWTRLGEYLPKTAAEQRRDRLLAAMQGYIGDGLLMRASMIRTGSAPQWETVSGFLKLLIKATPTADRRVLIGTALSDALRNG